MEKFILMLKGKQVKNGIYLYILQFFNTIIPMVTLPYILRIFGPEQYGFFALALNIIGYIGVMIEYSFNYTGVKKIAIANDIEKLSLLVSNITACKLLIFFIAFLGFIIFSLLYVRKDKLYWCLVILWFYLFGLAIQQIWVFQGLSAMKYITYVNVISRIISVALIFLLINNDTQIILYTFLYTVTTFLSAVISNYILYYKFKIKFIKPNMKAIYKELKDGKYLFWTKICTKVFSGLSITVLGIFASVAYSGVYSALQKIPSVITMIFYPISTVLFPYVSRIFSKSFLDGVQTVKKMFTIVMICFSIGALLIAVFAKKLIVLIYGSKYTGYQNILYILLLWSLFSIANNFLGIQFLIASGYDKIYNKCFNISLIAIIILTMILGTTYNLLGVACATLISEMILTITMLYCIKNICARQIVKDNK